MFDIDGWIEVTRDAVSEQNENSWSGVVRISPLVDGPDELSERLFGLSKRFITSGGNNALAAKRGLPQNPSRELGADLQRINEHERQFGAGEFGGYTYATWNEVAEFRESLPIPSESDWAIVFDMVARLADDERLSGDRIRFVLWYSW